MKNIITENQKNMIIENAIFKMLGNEKYNIIDKGDSIYFVKNNEDEYADIRYGKKHGWCWIYHELISTFSLMTSSEPTDVKEIIGRYVEDTLQIKMKHITNSFSPLKNTVEDTPQMKVKHISTIFSSTLLPLEIPYIK
jgi:hypothetical protein